MAPPREFIQNTNIIWRLNKALYGLRAAPKLWQQHLGATLAQLHLHQLKSDHCVWVSRQLAVRRYVDDLIIIIILFRGSSVSPGPPATSSNNFRPSKLVKNDDNNISTPSPRRTKLLKPLGHNKEHVTTAGQQSRSSDLLWIQHRPCQKNNIISTVNLWGSFLGLALFVQLFNMISANIWPAQCNWIFNNSNTVFDTSKALSITNSVFIRNHLIFLFQ